MRLFTRFKKKMESGFIRVTLRESEKADETWINPDHIVAVAPDPGDRFMVVVLDVVGAKFGGGPKVYKISFESGQELLRA